MGVNLVFTLQEISCKYADVECSMDCVCSELFGGYSLYVPIIYPHILVWFEFVKWGLLFTHLTKKKRTKKNCFKICAKENLPTFLPHWAACGILVPRPGMELTSPVVEAGSLNHPTTRKTKNLPF